MPESLPIYGPGFTVSQDRFGNLVDISASTTERWCALGVAWNMPTGYQSFTATGQYAYITFKTPATGRVFYNFAQLDKTGDEIVKSLIEGCTATAGTAVTPENFDCDILASACPLTEISFGKSASSQTITGGVEKFPSMAAGTSQGNSKPGGQSALVGVIKLKQNTVYALKLLSKGSSTFMVSVGIGYLSQYP